MLRRVLDVTRWPVFAVFSLAGLSPVVFALVTVSLFTQTLANFRLLTDYGWEAAIDGGLMQLAGLAATGAAALCCYLAYKICEGELIGRYFRWIGQDHNHRR